MSARVFKKRRGKFDELREQRKKRRGDVATQNALSKRQRLQPYEPESAYEKGTTGHDPSENFDDDLIVFEDTRGDLPVQEEAVFYGLLDTEEQTYYSNVNSKIVSNDFESDEDRRAFITAVYRESEGKELKLASSQSCSRYLQKLLILSTADQLRRFFQKFQGHFTHLVQHRFGSHVCETLFIESAKRIDSEPRAGKQAGQDTGLELESLLVQACQEIQPNIGFMLTDRFASHVVRVLLIILAGAPLDDASTQALVASKKKERLDIPAEAITVTSSSRVVPKLFNQALKDMTEAAVSTLDTTYLRAVATHPIGNPVLQLLLKLELTSSEKGRQISQGSLFAKLIPPESIEETGDSTQFLLGLSYDSTGSHLIEILVVHSPGKIFKKLYKNVWKQRLGSMARNDIASHVVVRILERLGKDDLAEARDAIIPELPTLLRRRRTIVVKSLVDRSVVRNLDLQSVASSIKTACNDVPGGVLLKILGLEELKSDTLSSDTNRADLPMSRADTHGSLLAQAMIDAPSVGILIEESLLALDSETLILLCLDPAASRVIQTALNSSNTSLGFRKQMIQKFFGHIVQLAKSPVGSYTVDSLWTATGGLHFMKEQIAAELASSEAELRESLPGRQVWRNWSMDIHQRRPGEWRALAKGQRQIAPTGEQTKSAFQIAQERYVEQHRKSRPQSGSSPQIVPTNA